MWICLNCNKRIHPKNITYQEKCYVCGKNVYTEEEIKSFFIKFCAFRLRHDLYNIWEELKEVKENPKRETAQGKLWIDELIDRTKKLERTFSKDVNGNTL